MPVDQPTDDADMLVDQPSSDTVRKVKYAASAATLATLAAPLSLIAAAYIVEFVPAFRDVEEALALVLSAAITGAVTWVTGYMTRNRRGPAMSGKSYQDYEREAGRTVTWIVCAIAATIFGAGMIVGAWVW